MSTENIKAMMAEIEKMQAFVLLPENYERGYDTMAECWDDTDYERLFYKINTDKTTAKFQPEVRCTFAEAWDCLHSIASVFRERQADADFHASQA